MGSLRIGSRYHHVPINDTGVVLLSPTVREGGDGFEILKVGRDHRSAGGVEILCKREMVDFVTRRAECIGVRPLAVVVGVAVAAYI